MSNKQRKASHQPKNLWTTAESGSPHKPLRVLFRVVASQHYRKSKKTPFRASTKGVFLLFLHPDSAYQPVVHFLVFLCGDIPGEVNCHSAVNHLVPFTFTVIVNLLGITDACEHFVCVVVYKTEARSGTLVFIVRFYGILKTSRFTYNRKCSVT